MKFAMKHPAPFFPRTLLALGLSGMVMASLPAGAESVRIGILHVNDVYQIRPDGGRAGGIARVAALQQQLQPQYRKLFFTFGGDTLSPSVTSSTFKGKQMIAAWNAAKLDLAVLGNHEFDHGLEVLKTRLQESSFPWLAANVQGRNGEAAGLPNVRPEMIYEVAGMRIAFLGVMTDEGSHVTRNQAVMQVQPPVAQACNLARQLREQKQADVVVALTHIDLEDDRKLAADCPVDLILGGHGHFEVIEQVNGKPVAKAGADAGKALLVEFGIDTASHLPGPVAVRLVPLDASVPEVPAVREVARQYEEHLMQALQEPVGRTLRSIDARDQSVRMHQTNAGTLVAEAFRSQLKTDFALVNGGGLRGDRRIPAGVLRRQDIKNLLPFENHVYRLELSGADLLTTLQGLGDNLGKRPLGRYPHVAGMQLTIRNGQVTGIHVNGKPIQPGKRYTLAVANFLAEGNDGYLPLKQARRLDKEDNAPLETELLMTYVQQQKLVRF